MRQTEIVIKTFLLIVLVSGCASGRKSRTEEDRLAMEKIDLGNIENVIEKNNISRDGFVIKKGKIELGGTEIKGTFSFILKLNEKGNISASLKGPLGIELGRVLAVENDVCAIDRLNRTVYIAKKDELLKKYGLPKNFVSIIFGDMSDRNFGTANYESDGRIILKKCTEDYIEETTLCADMRKICNEKINHKKSGKVITLDYDSFISEGNKSFASEISIEEEGKMFHVKLNIIDIQMGCKEKIKFVFPDYKRKNL
jgi:hypothetical protein